MPIQKEGIKVDKKGHIQEHSKIKLQLYRSYLELYLSVLLVSGSFNALNVYDLFAGRGKSADGDEGSALLAAKAITEIRKKYPTKPVLLKLNEKRKDHLANLTDVLKPYSNFTEVTEQDADEFLTSWKPAYGVHNLFFIDPHGYTQVSTNNLKQLFSLQACDCLIFIPVYHIYRFLKPSEEDIPETETDFFEELGIKVIPAPRDKEKYYKPIADFLSGLGIEKTSTEKCATVEDFFSVIVDALKKISGSEFVYSEIIKKHGYNSKYGLFFISHSILGAEKFLEAQKKLKASTNRQVAFDFIPPSIEGGILSLLQDDREYSNTELYAEGIRRGILPSEMLNLLKAAEKSTPQAIEISVISGKTRNRGGFYISYKHYKEGNKIILVKIKK